MENIHEKIEYFTIHNPKSNILKDDMKSRYESQDEQEIINRLDKELVRPFNHLISNPGKNIRQTLIQALNHWSDIPQEKLEIIIDITFNLHNFTLLIDDIQDNSSLRRGIPTAHTIFGVANTINTANFIGCINLNKIFALNHPEAVKVALESMLAIVAGQGMELYWRENFICPTEEEYLQMVSRKTGGVFQAAKNLMELFTANGKDVNKFLIYSGLYFQINDDYQNLNSEVFFNSKGFCEDITEGKFGFPIVHAINSCPKQGKLIMDILRQRTTDIELKKRCLSHIDACGSFEYTRNKIAELRRMIFEEINVLGGNPYIDDFFEKLAASCL